MVHAGISHNADLQDISLLPVCLGGKASGHDIQFLADAAAQGFCPMGERIVRPHDHISSVLCLRIHPALHGQNPSVGRIQKIACQCGGADVKGGKAEISPFGADIQDLTRCMCHIPGFALAALLIKRG